MIIHLNLDARRHRGLYLRPPAPLTSDLCQTSLLRIKFRIKLLLAFWIQNPLYFLRQNRFCFHLPRVSGSGPYQVFHARLLNSTNTYRRLWLERTLAGTLHTTTSGSSLVRKNFKDRQLVTSCCHDHRRLQKSPRANRRLVRCSPAGHSSWGHPLQLKRLH